MPALPASERTSYVYDEDKDEVTLIIDGVPKLQVNLNDAMLLAAAKELKKGRKLKSKPKDKVVATASE